MAVKSFIRKKIAQRKLDNLCLDLREQELEVRDWLKKGVISNEAAKHYYGTIYEYGLDQYREIASKYDLKEMGLDAYRSVEITLNHMNKKSKATEVQVTM